MDTLRNAADNYPPDLHSQEERKKIEDLWRSLESGLLATLEQKAAPEGDVEQLLGDVYRMGHNLGVAGAREKATVHLQKACDLKPAEPMPQLFLGRHLTFSGDFAKGEVPLLQAYRMTPPDAATDLVYLLAHNYYFQKRFDLAVQFAERFPKDHPGAPQIAMLRDSAKEALETGKVPGLLAIPFDHFGSHPPLALAATLPALGYQEPSFASYYRNPKPDTLSGLLEELQKQGSLTQGHMTAAGFLSQIFRDNPDRLDAWAPAIRKLDDPAREYVWQAAWLAGTEAARKLLEAGAKKETETVRASLAGYLSQSTPPLVNFPADSGPALDIFWGAFFATGKPEYVAKIIDALPLILSDPEKNGPDMAVGLTAAWSLQENASRHPRVLEICKSERDRRSGDVRHLLSRLILRAERKD